MNAKDRNELADLINARIHTERALAKCEGRPDAEAIASSEADHAARKLWDAFYRLTSDDACPSDCRADHVTMRGIRADCDGVPLDV